MWHKRKGVTSMENELGKKSFNEVKEKLTKHFEYLFEAILADRF